MTTSANKLLGVDDEPDILEILRYNMEKEGCDATLWLNGEEAPTVMSRPDLILLYVRNGSWAGHC